MTTDLKSYTTQLKQELAELGVELSPQLIPHITDDERGVQMLENLIQQAKESKREEEAIIKQLGIDQQQWNEQIMRLQEMELLGVNKPQQDHEDDASKTYDLDERVCDVPLVTKYLNESFLAEIPFYCGEKMSSVSEALKSAIDLAETASPEKDISVGNRIVQSDQTKVFRVTPDGALVNADIDSCMTYDHNIEPSVQFSQCTEAAMEQDPALLKQVHAQTADSIKKIQMKNIEHINVLLEQERCLHDQAMESVRKQIAEHVSRTGATIPMPTRDQLFGKARLDKQMLMTQVNEQTDSLISKVEAGLKGDLSVTDAFEKYKATLA